MKRWSLAVLPVLACLPCVVSAVGAWAILGAMLTLGAGALTLHLATTFLIGTVVLATIVTVFILRRRAAMLRTTQSL